MESRLQASSDDELSAAFDSVPLGHLISQLGHAALLTQNMWLLTSQAMVPLSPGDARQHPRAALLVLMLQVGPLTCIHRLSLGNGFPPSSAVLPDVQRYGSGAPAWLPWLSGFHQRAAGGAAPHRTT